MSTTRTFSPISVRLRVTRMVALASVLTASGIPAPARADFQAAVNLSNAAQDASYPDVAMDAEGNAVIAWHRLDGTHWRVQTRELSADGALGPVQTLSSSGHHAILPQVAVNPGGAAMIVWQRHDDDFNYRIQSRVRSSSGTLGLVHTLSDAGESAQNPDVAVDADGGAVIVWYRAEGPHYRVQARSHSRRGLGPVRTLSLAGQHAVNPQIGMDADGNSMIVWRTHDGDNYRIQARARVANGELGSVQTISLVGQSALNPRIAVNPDGDAVIVWYVREGQDWKIQARAASVFGLWKPIQTLSAAGQDAGAPQVAVDEDGNAIFVWQRNDGSNERIQLRTRSADGTLGQVQNLSVAGQNAEHPQLAVDSDGNAVIVWRRVVGGSYRIQARTRSADGTLGPIQALSEAGENAFFPQVAVRRGGAVDRAVAVWFRSDGAKDRVQATVGP